MALHTATGSANRKGHSRGQSPAGARWRVAGSATWPICCGHEQRTPQPAGSQGPAVTLSRGRLGLPPSPSSHRYLWPEAPSRPVLTQGFPRCRWASCGLGWPCSWPSCPATACVQAVEAASPHMGDPPLLLRSASAQRPNGQQRLGTAPATGDVPRRRGPFLLLPEPASVRAVWAPAAHPAGPSGPSGYPRSPHTGSAGRTPSGAPRGPCNQAGSSAPKRSPWADSFASHSAALGRPPAARPGVLDTHRDEAAEGGVGGVVRDEEAHVLVADLHGGRPVHPRHGCTPKAGRRPGRAAGGAGDAGGRRPQQHPQNPRRTRSLCLSKREKMLL